MAFIICRSCSAENSDRDLYCYNCGAYLKEGPAPQTLATRVDTPSGAGPAPQPVAPPIALETASPVDLLRAQQRTLEAIRAEQAAQAEAHQRLLAALISQRTPASETLHVKIEDLNMPFWALVGFILKLTFASIPAAILFLFISTILGAVFSGVLAAVLSATGAGAR